jgi:CxxC motif-containing protein (DUF1111 family)
MFRHKPSQWFNVPLATAAFMTIFMLSIDGAFAACRGEWAEGNNYAVGDIASFDGIRYRALQAHTSFANAGWTPPRTPALWTSSSVGSCPNIPFDPGVRAGVSAGNPIAGLTPSELAAFEIGLEDFEELEGIGDGLGPRFNADGCGACHSKPAIGGTADSTNPQVPLATAFGARNTVPSFLTVNGPIREARFKRFPNGQPDGGVHGLFVISGRVDESGNASGCNIVQEDFATQLNNRNVIFRIPSPTFGNGLMEQIADSAILANLNANASQKSALGISGRVNRNGNDGTITRFGWKAQVKSALLFSGEAYNVEMGISNELFQQERDETPSCQFAQLPNDVNVTDAEEPLEFVNAIEKFAFFMRFLGPPTPSGSTPGGSTSISNGRNLFNSVGCALCHTPTLTTGDSTVAALRNRPVNLFSDLALHNMGPGLADEVSQGEARPDEFRTAPLWGLGQRAFFLHDGRTKDLLVAIQAHASAANGTFQASEANGVINKFNALGASQKQDLLNFLRSL